MNAKEYLSRIAKLETLINAKKQRVDALNCMATNCNANYTGMPQSGTRKLSPMEDATCKAVSLEDEIRRDKIALQRKRVFILELIGKLENIDYETVLIKRYFERYEWDDISLDMHYSIRWVYTLHGRALQALNALMEEADEVP